MKIKLDLSNFATKTHLKNAARIDTPSFPRKGNLASLKSNVDKIRY